MFSYLGGFCQSFLVESRDRLVASDRSRATQLAIDIFYHTRPRKVPLGCWHDSCYCMRIPPMAGVCSNFHQNLLHTLGACLQEYGSFFQSVRRFEGGMQYSD
ncbi:hypothetical protein HanHA300_Chr14g0533191 [Helianthus annuus]|nr:hypothetical protein HanHA300_Chr14g0533191 [Helianthus annuus]